MAKSFFSTSGPGGVPDDAHSHATQSGMSLEPTMAPRFVTGFRKAQALNNFGACAIRPSAATVNIIGGHEVVGHVAARLAR